jgi:hypothetical protein
MSDPASTDQATRAIRRLSVAVWILAIVVAANLVVSILQFFYPALLASRIMTALPQKLIMADGSTMEEYNSFHDWPVERQIQAASVIALARWEKSGPTLRCIISEILKQASNTKFYYKVGDEYRSRSLVVRDDKTDYGDGQIIFFTGSPASARFSTGWKGDRLTGLGDMPIAELRELIRKSSP